MIPLVKPFIAPKEEMLPEIENILYSGYIAEGQAVYDFENDLRRLLDNDLVLAVNSGTSALHLALMLLNIGNDDEVISTPMTAEPTNTIISMTGAKIVWADIDPKTGLLLAESVRKKITNKTKAIMLVHYAGMVCDLNEFNKISIEYNIPIIEDAAHAFGSKFNNKIIGSNSRFTCYSFQAIKQLTTIDGGAISFQNENDFIEARKLRWFGLDKSVPRLQNNITRVGMKYNMNNVTATIGRVQLRFFKENLEKSIETGKFFDENLSNIKGLELIEYYENTTPSYWLYTLKVDRRDDFINMMKKNGITASPLHHRNDLHSVFSRSKCDLPNLDEFYSRFIHIPCGWWISDVDRKKIVELIRNGW